MGQNTVAGSVMAERDGKDLVYCGEYLNSLASIIHLDNEKWWPIHKGNRNVGEAIALCHSELSEALEGHRKHLMDDKLPHYRMLPVELADCIIRILDLAVGLGYDNIGDILIEKMVYNRHREDHKIENRAKENGKKY